MVKKTEKTKSIKSKVDRESLASVDDCKFVDSYGISVKHGTKIVIEENYNSEFFNNKEAIVEWYPEKGMYRFILTDDIVYKSRHDFWGIHHFRVIE